MAEEAKEQASSTDAAAKGGGDDIKNLKAEFDRKLSNIEKSNQALIAQLQSVIKPREAAKPKEEPSFKDLWYDDPDTSAKIIKKQAKDEAKSEIMGELRRQQEAQAKQGSVIQQLYREYPELQDFDHPLTSKAVEIFEKFTDDDKQHPMAYRLAVKEAAEELQIKVKSKRPAQDDDFSLGNSSGKTPKQSRKSKEVDGRTLDFARLVGLNVDDEKVMERLKERSQRQNWQRWE